MFSEDVTILGGYGAILLLCFYPVIYCLSSYKFVRVGSHTSLYPLCGNITGASTGLTVKVTARVCQGSYTKWVLPCYASFQEIGRGIGDGDTVSPSQVSSWNNLPNKEVSSFHK